MTVLNSSRMHSRVQFGMETTMNRSNDVLTPVSSFRNLVKKQQENYIVGPSARIFRSAKFPSEQIEPFSDESEAIQELQELKEQGGEGVLDFARAAFQLGKKVLPAAFGTIEKALPVVGTALKVGKVLGSLATGKVGTTISNVLSEKFNKNPEWRPGFPGEAHLVLPTKFGLTRANFCGPQTNLQKRLKRGDKGVSQIDSACEIHDSLYSLAKSEQDIRAADKRLIRDIDKATDAGPTQKAVLKAGIKAKTLGEDVGLFGPETFTKIPGLQTGSGPLSRLAVLPVDLGHLRQNRFLNNTGRDVRSLLTSGIARSGLSQIKRMGGNGVIHPSTITDDNLMRLARRLQRAPLGNVKRADPTISGITTGAAGASQGRGKFESRKPGYGNPCSIIPTGSRKLRGGGISGSTIGLQHPNRQIRPIFPFTQPSTNIMASTDQTRRKAIDPTIRNDSTGAADGFTGQGIHGGSPFKTADPLGGGIKEIFETPAKLLHKAVTKTLKKQRKKKKPAVKLAGKLIRQLGLGGHQDGGQFGILASIAASIIVPEIIKAIKGRGIQAGSGPGKKLALDVARRHGLTAKNLGMTAKQVKTLLSKVIRKSVQGKGISGPALPGNIPGGQFGSLVGLAASTLAPELIKLARRKSRII